MTDNRQSIYIAGPMKGKPENNYPAFHAAAKAWRNAGWYVESPAENPPDMTLAQYSHEGFMQLLSCDAIALLPGWQESVGAKAELHVAQLCGMKIYDAVTMAHYCGEWQSPPKVRTIVTAIEQTPVGGER